MKFRVSRGEIFKGFLSASIVVRSSCFFKRVRGSENQYRKEAVRIGRRSGHLQDRRYRYLLEQGSSLHGREVFICLLRGPVRVVKGLLQVRCCPDLPAIRLESSTSPWAKASSIRVEVAVPRSSRFVDVGSRFFRDLTSRSYASADPFFRQVHFAAVRANVFVFDPRGGLVTASYRYWVGVQLHRFDSFFGVNLLGDFLV